MSTGIIASDIMSPGDPHDDYSMIPFAASSHGFRENKFVKPVTADESESCSSNNNLIKQNSCRTSFDANEAEVPYVSNLVSASLPCSCSNRTSWPSDYQSLLKMYKKQSIRLACAESENERLRDDLYALRAEYDDVIHTSQGEKLQSTSLLREAESLLSSQYTEKHRIRNDSEFLQDNEGWEMRCQGFVDENVKLREEISKLQQSTHEIEMQLAMAKTELAQFKQNHEEVEQLQLEVLQLKSTLAARASNTSSSLLGRFLRGTSKRAGSHQAKHSAQSWRRYPEDNIYSISPASTHTSASGLTPSYQAQRHNEAATGFGVLIRSFPDSKQA